MTRRPTGPKRRTALEAAGRGQSERLRSRDRSFWITHAAHIQTVGRLRLEECNSSCSWTILHGREAADEDFPGGHSPLDMMERAIVLAAFCVRRLVEKRLLTDSFVAKKRQVRSFPAVAGPEFRPPFHGASGGSAFSNYDFQRAQFVSLTAGDLANEIIHSSQLMIVDGEAFAEDGFLIASDLRLHQRLLHLSFQEFEAFGREVLADQVALQSDRWDPETGKVSSERLGPRELPRLQRSALRGEPVGPGKTER